MKKIHLLTWGLGLFTVFSAYAESPVLTSNLGKVNQHSGLMVNNFDRYGKQKSILQLETQFKKNGSLISSEHRALQARLDKVSQAIRNLNTMPSIAINAPNSAVADKLGSQVQVKDDPKLYLDK
jgi:hypothetical protein